AIALDAGGRELRGRVTDRDGAAVAGAGIWTAPISDPFARIYTNADAQGRWSVRVPPGREYAIWSEAGGRAGEAARARSDLDGEIELMAIEPRPTPPAVVAEIGQRAVHLAGASAGADLADLEPVLEMAGDARVV